MLKKILLSLGLPPELAQLYETLLDQGPSTPGELSSLTGITRTYIYTLGDQLVDLGFASWTEDNNVKHLSPSSPQVISLLLNQKSSETQLAQSALTGLLPDLKKRYDILLSSPIETKGLTISTATNTIVSQGTAKKLKQPFPYDISISRSTLLIAGKPVTDTKIKKVIISLATQLFNSL